MRSSNRWQSAPEEFWQSIILPLLFIGAPATFPPVDPDDLEAFRAGADPLALFVELVPYQRRAPEEGLLGAFDVSDVTLPHPSFQRVGSPRLFRLDREKVAALVKDFDAARTRDAVARFTAYLEEKARRRVGQFAAMMALLATIVLVVSRPVWQDHPEPSQLLGFHLHRVGFAQGPPSSPFSLGRRGLLVRDHRPGTLEGGVEPDAQLLKRERHRQQNQCRQRHDPRPRYHRGQTAGRNHAPQCFCGEYGHPDELGRATLGVRESEGDEGQRTQRR